MPLRLLLSSIGSPCFALTGPLGGRFDSFIKNYSHLIELLKSVNLRGQDILVPFDVVSLFSNIPVYEAGLITTTHWQNCLS
jgi:hypothetical protein